MNEKTENKLPPEQEQLVTDFFNDLYYFLHSIVIGLVELIAELLKSPQIIEQFFRLYF